MTETQRATDTQIGGDHYRSMAIQPSEFIQRNGLNWCEGNVIKYLARHRNKNGAQDIQKAIHYCQLLLEWEYPGHGKTAADYTPLSPSKVKEIAESVAPVVLCVSCARACREDVRDATVCNSYLPKVPPPDSKWDDRCADFDRHLTPPPSDEWETKDLCRRCGSKRCSMAGRTGATTICINYVGMVALDEPEEKAPAPLSLSSASLDLVAHLHRQREFSRSTFGPGPRTAGVIDHIRKELKEIEAAPHDLEEWVDLILLALDGAWRAGNSPEEIAAGLEKKQIKNEGRTWPDWRTAPADKAIEHDRSKD